MAWLVLVTAWSRRLITQILCLAPFFLSPFAERKPFDYCTLLLLTPGIESVPLTQQVSTLSIMPLTLQHSKWNLILNRDFWWLTQAKQMQQKRSDFRGCVTHSENVPAILLAPSLRNVLHNCLFMISQVGAIKKVPSWEVRDIKLVLTAQLQG